MIFSKWIAVGCCVLCLLSCRKADAPVLDSIGAKVITVQQDEQFDLLPTSTTNLVVRHDFYTLSYDEDSEQAEWVAYELKKEYLKNNDYKRPYFIDDPKVASGSANWSNYKKSGYDKGHLCPAGDMEFDVKAYNETFFTSNISPQNHEFNAGIWNRLEQKVRYWAGRYDGVYVITGGVITPFLGTIGREGVAVPELFYKIILDRRGGQYKMIGFLIPNKPSDKALFHYVVAVDSIEKMTGIDFFPSLEDTIENKLESSVDKKPWF